eukprot:TRINITY_DN1212_c0_g1_i2.p1 TRINITY_DN1212_c0_g1~~TRINITY_DN1212_c0_g1_i2.p1  ORF type:complete len:447 (-),score=22.83 TRINITY_DN1212_c0_g1_i2:828-2168(-)
MVLRVSRLLILSFVWLSFVFGSRAKLRVGFVYASPPSDISWGYQLESARLYLPQIFPRYTLMTDYLVYPSPSDLPNVINSLVGKNCSLIFVSVNNCEDWSTSIADVHKAIHFVLLSCPSNRPNENSISLSFSTCFSFLGALGAIVHANRSGLILDGQFPESSEILKGYVSGLRAADPSHQLYVLFLKDSSDLVLKKAVMSLARNQVRLIGGVTSNGRVSHFASSLGYDTFSYPSDVSQTVNGVRVLSGCTINWVPSFSFFIRREIQSIWKPQQVFESSFENGGVTLNMLSPEVPIDAQTRLSRLAFNIFDSSFANKSLSLDYSENVIIVNFTKEEQVQRAIYVEHDSIGAIAVYLLILIACVVIIFWVVLFSALRRNSTMAVINRSFYYNFLLGNAIAYGSLFFWIGKPSDVICLLRLWLLEVAFCFHIRICFNQVIPLLEIMEET